MWQFNRLRLNRTSRSVATLLVLLWANVSSVAQNNANPFELSPRLDATAIGEGDTASGRTGNPFDLLAPSSVATAQKKINKTASERPPLSENDAQNRFYFVMVVSILLILTILMTILRSFFQKAYYAFLNDNMMNQVYRERESVGPLPFLLLYAYFFINAGLFAYFLAKHYNTRLPGGHFLQWLYYTGGLIALFSLKHLLLRSIGFIFPVEKEVKLYNFQIVVFAIVIGLILTPVNILLAYGPEPLSNNLIYLSLVLLALIYIFRYLRSLLIANRFLLFHKFHFLLYICSVEIAPVMVLVKLILDQI